MGKHEGDAAPRRAAGRTWAVAVAEQGSGCAVVTGTWPCAHRGKEGRRHRETAASQELGGPAALLSALRLRVDFLVTNAAERLEK